jgi:hypothetical protein
MTELINQFIKQNEAVLEFLEHSRSYYKEADEFIPQFNDFLQRAKFNIALGQDYANILQLSNDEDISGQYQLEDIQRMFDSMLKLQPYNLDSFVDAANFEYSVMDDNAAARKIAEAGIRNAQQKIEELQTLLHVMSRRGWQ